MKKVTARQATRIACRRAGCFRTRYNNPPHSWGRLGERAMPIFTYSLILGFCLLVLATGGAIVPFLLIVGGVFYFLRQL